MNGLGSEKVEWIRINQLGLVAVVSGSVKMVANVKAQTMHSVSIMDVVLVCVGSRTVRCMRYFIAHFLCFCTDRYFLPCLLSFFYSNFFASLSSFIHWSFSPRLDCVSNLRLSISHISVSLFSFIASLVHSFDRFHPCEVGLLRGVIDGLYCNDGNVSSSSSSSYCSHHDTASVVAMHWVHWCRNLSRLLSFAMHSSFIQLMRCDELDEGLLL